jgi:capsid portal protein
LINDSSKLFLYSKLKADIKLEKYLKKWKKFQKSSIVDNISFKWSIELGRYKNIPRNQRHCKFCKTLDDEFHFFFDCKVTDNIRPSFIDFMKTKYPHFNQLDSLEKLKLFLILIKFFFPVFVTL